MDRIFFSKNLSCFQIDTFVFCFTESFFLSYLFYFFSVGQSQQFTGYPHLPSADPKRMLGGVGVGVGQENNNVDKNIKVTLENRDLWNKFHGLGTEMIITKTGR